MILAVSPIKINTAIQKHNQKTTIRQNLKKRVMRYTTGIEKESSLCTK